MPIRLLPRNVVYPKGKLSLVAKPASAGMALYLINDSKAPIKGAVNEYTRVVQEAKAGERWRRVSPMRISDCGTFSPPKDLMPGEVLVFAAPAPEVGDVEADLRYCLRPELGLVSQTIRGKFSSSEFEEAGLDYGATSGISREVVLGLQMNNWSSCRLAKSPEEIAALLELDRAYDECRTSRKNAEIWLESLKARPVVSAEEQRCANRIREILALPWNRSRDDSALFERCLTALGPREKGFNPPYGTPEKFRGNVWAYMRSTESNGLEYLTIEQSAEAAKRWESGNRWGATKQQLSALRAAAAYSIREGDEDERRSAAAFLCESWWPVDLVKDRDLFDLLEKDDSYVSCLIVARLAARGKREDILSWLTQDPGLDAERRASLWLCSVQRGQPLGEKDLQLFKSSLGENFEAACVIERSRDGRESNADEFLRWGENFRIVLREALAREAASKSIKGPDVPPLDPAGPGSPENSRKDREVSALRMALGTLSIWKNPEDTPLIWSFLSHPANSFALSSVDGRVRTYPIRDHAMLILRERGEKVDPSKVVLQEKY